MVPSRIDVAIEEDDGGWIAEVTVTEGPTSTTHRVRMTREALQRLAPDASVADVVQASFRFLLEHERKESILSAFDIEAIGKYFPEFPDELARRFQSGP